MDGKEESVGLGVGTLDLVSRDEINALTAVANEMFRQGAPPNVVVQLPFFVLAKMLKAHLFMARTIDSIVATEDSAVAREIAVAAATELAAAPPPPPPPRVAPAPPGLILPGVKK